MLDPSYDLQVAVFSALSTNAGVIAAMPSVEMFDSVPLNPPFPYLYIGDDQILLGDNYQFSQTCDAHVQVHVFSRYSGKTEVKKIAGAVRMALEGYLAINNFRVLTYEFITIRYMTDPDGLTQHAIVEVKYEISQ